MTIAVGVNVEVPDATKRIEQGPVIVLGDCASEDLKTHPGVTFILGFPPTANLTPTFKDALRRYGIEIEEM